LRFPVPSTASPARAPYEAGCHLRLGSALRLSQPLSGFLASASFVALFHATASSWDPPFRVFPSQRARTPLEAACSLAVIHQRSETHRPTSYRPRFRRRPRFHAVAWFPRELWAPFPQTECLLPGCPGSRTVKRTHPASFTCFGALFPLRIRSYSAQVAPNRAADTLLGFSPSRAFALRASDPC
jgi:hypothetical protein